LFKPVALSSLTIRFKCEYMSFTSSFGCIVKQCFCSWTLLDPSWSSCNFSKILFALVRVNTWLKMSMLIDSNKKF
jgi:hypothetical protein